MENDDPGQILKENGGVDVQAPAASQTSSNDTLGSNLNAATFVHNEQPQMNLLKIKHEDTQRESAAITIIRDHIGAANDRMAVLERKHVRVYFRTFRVKISVVVVCVCIRFSIVRQEDQSEHYFWKI